MTNLGNDETIETTALSVKDLGEIIAPNAIRKEHKAIGSDLIQRVQLMLDREPEIDSYSVEKDWNGRPTEKLKLKLDGAALYISLSHEK